MMDCLEISSKDSRSTINYLSNIAMDRDNNFRPLKWNNSVILRNCCVNGQLVDLKKPSENLPWLLLTLKPFTYQGQVYPVFSCSSCSPNIMKMSVEQNPTEFVNILCFHSKVARCLVDNWRETFEIPDSADLIKESYKTKCTPMH